MKKIFCLIVLGLIFLAASPALAAGPLLKLNPSSGSYNVGDTFKVTLGVDSGTEKSQGVDAWLTFDKEKLEVQSIETASSPAFSFALGKNIYNDTGKFDISCSSTDMGTYQATVLSGDLVVVTFKTKATGTATVNFVCSSGSTVDSNIFNMSAADVIDCASNIGGSYTINSGSSSSEATPTQTTSTTSTSDSSELPQTGGVGTTIGLMIFGIVGILSSIALRFL
jgi:hypothetical protein